jgi:hypothetical protein
MTKAEFTKACQIAAAQTGDIEGQMVIFRYQFLDVTEYELNAARCAFEMLKREREEYKSVTVPPSSTGWWSRVFKWGQSE